MTFHTQFTNTGPQTDIELEQLLHNPYPNDLKASKSSSELPAFYLEKLQTVVFNLLGHCWQTHVTNLSFDLLKQTNNRLQVHLLNQLIQEQNYNNISNYKEQL